MVFGHTRNVKKFLNSCEKLECVGVITDYTGEVEYRLHQYKDEIGNIWEEIVQAEGRRGEVFLGAKSNTSKEENVIGWKFDNSPEKLYIDHESGCCSASLLKIR